MTNPTRLCRDGPTGPGRPGPERPQAEARAGRSVGAGRRSRAETARLCSTLATLLVACAAAGPATRDATADILGLSAPATRPTAPPATLPSVFKPSADDGETRTGTVTLSDGTTVTGRIATTAEKPIRIWVPEEKQYEDVALSQVATAEAHVVWERLDPEWDFKQSGSDVKVYSGRTYPARETTYAVTLTDGTVLSGGVVAPLYVTTADGKTRTLVLHKRDKGPAGRALAALVYVKRVELK